MPDSTLSALSNIRTKIRRLTRNPSEAQLSTADIDNYINNFILYDFPAYVKLDSLKKMLTFYTTAYTDTYYTNTADPADPLYNFKNKYTNVQAPVYISGKRAVFSQSVEEFYGIYPLSTTRISIGTGDGVNQAFTGTLDNVPILQNHVTISSIDINDNRLLLTDDGDGILEGDDGAVSTIDYNDGTYDLTFSDAPDDGEDVWMETHAYTTGEPVSLLLFNNELTVRPVPDGAYRIDIIALQRPTEMDNPTDLPELSEWWQYIAYGAAIKILQDRLDMETVALITPEFNNQETLIMRRKIIKNSGKRAATIFTSGYMYDKDFIGGD